MPPLVGKATAAFALWRILTFGEGDLMVLVNLDFNYLG
jgi:hypothetical protein